MKSDFKFSLNKNLLVTKKTTTWLNLWSERLNELYNSSVVLTANERSKKSYDSSILSKSSFGFVSAFNDCVVTVNGIEGAYVNELLYFKSGVSGLVLNLEDSGLTIKALIFQDVRTVNVGDKVTRTRLILRVGVGFQNLGRLLNPIGIPLDRFPRPRYTQFREVEIKAPGVVTRSKINEPLLTGVKIIDALVPIGRGQRELILGDRRTGKTTIAIDSILNQKSNQLILKSPVYCIYVSIGKRMSEVKEAYRILSRKKALHYCTLVAARASDPVSLQFLAPYSACSMAEYFTYKNMHSLIVFDDLSRHADAYRQMSLLLKRPVGREAFPGDIFYLHSRLLERAVNLRYSYGGGSLTALPIVETIQGDVSAYIPTNIISITDGQIYLDLARHQQGFRPAVDPGLSVSRIGSAAQSALVKRVAGSLKLQLAQYRELSLFVKFGSEIDAATRDLLTEGKIRTELLLQNLYSPVSPFSLSILLFACSTPLFASLLKIVGDDTRRLHVYLENFRIYMENSDVVSPFKVLAYETKVSADRMNYCLSLFEELQVYHYNNFYKHIINEEDTSVVELFNDRWARFSIEAVATVKLNDLFLNLYSYKVWSSLSIRQNSFRRARIVAFLLNEPTFRILAFKSGLLVNFSSKSKKHMRKARQWIWRRICVTKYKLHNTKRGKRRDAWFVFFSKLRANPELLARLKVLISENRGLSYRLTRLFKSIF